MLRLKRIDNELCVDKKTIVVRGDEPIPDFDPSCEVVVVVKGGKIKIIRRN